LAAAAAAGLWVLAGLAGVGRSREGLTPVRELRPNLFSERSGGGVFIYGVRAGASVLVIDAAADPRGRPVDLLLTAMHGAREHLTGLWATSARPDHVAGAAAFPAVPLYVGQSDLPVAAEARRLPSVFDRVLRLAWPPSSLPQARVAEAGTWPFVDGDATHILQAWPTPGPTAGSVSYLFDDILFVGDLLSWREGRLALPPPALDADPVATRRSVRQLAERVRPVALGLVCTGHGGCTPDGQGAHAWQQLLATLSPR